MGYLVLPSAAADFLTFFACSWRDTVQASSMLLRPPNGWSSEASLPNQAIGLDQVLRHDGSHLDAYQTWASFPSESLAIHREKVHFLNARRTHVAISQPTAIMRCLSGAQVWRYADKFQRILCTDYGYSSSISHLVLTNQLSVSASGLEGKGLGNRHSEKAPRRPQTLARLASHTSRSSLPPSF